MSKIGGIKLGMLPQYLFFWANGNLKAKISGPSNGFLGDIAINGITANEVSCCTIPYAGTIITNDDTLGDWQKFVCNNCTQATGETDQDHLIRVLKRNLTSAIKQINALPATPGYESIDVSVLDGLNIQNGKNETFVINITSGLNFKKPIHIMGDSGDVFILRWDTDGNPKNGYQGQLKPQNGAAIIPCGDLRPTNFISVAGDISSSGGGETPLKPYPQGPRNRNGAGALIKGGRDFNGGGFFTGYLLTTGAPGVEPDPDTGLYIGKTSPIKNGNFIGGWYSLTTEFSIESGSSGVYVEPNYRTLYNPEVSIKKYVSADNGITWQDGNEKPYPEIDSSVSPQFKFVVSNTGSVSLSNIVLTDNVYGVVGTFEALAVGESNSQIMTQPWSEGLHTNIVTATAVYGSETVTATDSASYMGVNPAIQIIKSVSPDNGNTWYSSAPWPEIYSDTKPKFKFEILNLGNVNLTDIVVTDNVLGEIGGLMDFPVFASYKWFTTGSWETGLHTNTANVTAAYKTTALGSFAEASYTGIGGTPAFQFEKFVSPDNGSTWYSSAPWPNIPQTVVPKFKFDLTNTGNVPLTDISIVDDMAGTMALASLVANDSHTWTYDANWNAGLQTNTANVTAHYNGEIISGLDTASYFGINPEIQITSYISTNNAMSWSASNTPPGITVYSFTTPMFRYLVTNLGNVNLTNIKVVDSIYGEVGQISTIKAGSSEEFFMIGSWAEGLQTATATATGVYETETVTDTDVCIYTGFQEILDIDFTKSVSSDGGKTWCSSEPWPNIISDIAPRFRLDLTNTSNVDLTSILVHDDMSDDKTLDKLMVGESRSWEYEVAWQAGTIVNNAFAGAEFQGLSMVSYNSASYFGATPAIDMVMYVSPDNGANWYDANTAPGPDIFSEISPQYKFVITNKGNAELTNIMVTDNVYGTIGSLASLGVGIVHEWIISKPWTQGAHSNTSTVTASCGTATVSDSDSVNYFGVNPIIAIQKYVSGDNGTTWVDANTSPGIDIYGDISPKFKFVVLNNGNVALSNVTITDSVYGSIGTMTTLAAGATNQWVITKSWSAGIHSNKATATATYGTKTVTTTDTAYYFGAAPAVSINKYVSADNGATWNDASTAPGPDIYSDVSPKFKFKVTNSGNTTLSNVTVTDNVYGSIGTLATLAAGASNEWIITKTWSAGNHSNKATVTGVYGTKTVTASDTAYYFGANPAITMSKLLSIDNGLTWLDAETAPGPTVSSDVTTKFRFKITNTGNTTLSNVVVMDSIYGKIGSLVSITAGTYYYWDATKPWTAGQHTNTATATATYGTKTVTSSNSVNYYGIAATIGIAKYVSADNGVTWDTANTAPGPDIYSDVMPQFKFTIKNTGTVDLSNITVTDTVFGNVGTLTSLAVSNSFDLVISRPWSAGAHANTATVTAYYGSKEVSASDSANYYGANPIMGVTTYVSADNGVTWIDSNTAPGPDIFSEVSPQLKFVVTNLGNVALSNVAVTDTVFGNVGTLTSLAVGSTYNWIVVDKWDAKAYTNTTTATAIYGTKTLTASDTVYYFGANPSFSLINSVLAPYGCCGDMHWVQATGPHGPNLFTKIDGETVQTEIGITMKNTGNVILTNVSIVDDKYGTLGANVTLEIGEEFHWNQKMAVEIGQHENTVIANATYSVKTVTKSSPLYYWGIKSDDYMDTLGFPGTGVLNSALVVAKYTITDIYTGEVIVESDNHMKGETWYYDFAEHGIAMGRNFFLKAHVEGADALCTTIVQYNLYDYRPERHCYFELLGNAFETDLSWNTCWHDF